jgi:hypothetical protein
MEAAVLSKRAPSRSQLTWAWEVIGPIGLALFGGGGGHGGRSIARFFWKPQAPARQTLR